MLTVIWDFRRKKQHFKGNLGPMTYKATSTDHTWKNYPLLLLLLPLPPLHHPPRPVKVLEEHLHMTALKIQSVRLVNPNQFLFQNDNENSVIATTIQEESKQPPAEETKF